MTRQILETTRRHWDFWKEFDEEEDTEATFCNCFVDDVCAEYNYLGFKDNIAKGQYFEAVLANTMYQIVNQPYSEWIGLGAKEAARQATRNKVVIAIAPAKGHGHVCIVLPLAMVRSGKWKKEVPRVANIGKDNFFGKGVNYAFKYEPEYYMLVKKGLVE